MIKLGTSGAGSLGEQVSPGVYGKTGIITSIKQEKDKTLGSYEPDLFVTFEINSGGKYPDTVEIFGSFQRDDVSGEVTDWGGAFQIDQAFQQLNGYEGIPEDELGLTEHLLIPSAVIENCIGKEVCYLLFAAGKNPNKDKMMWNTFPGLRLSHEDKDANKTAFNELYTALKGNDYHYGKLMKGRDYMERSTPSNTQGESSAPTAPRDTDGIDLPF